MKLWPPMSGAQIVKLVSSCSLLLLIALALPSTYREFAKELESASTSQEVLDVSERFSDLLDQDTQLANAIDEIDSGRTVGDIKQMVALRVASETPASNSASGHAKEIKSNPLFRDPGVQEQSNWLDGAVRRLMNLIPKDNKPPDFNPRNAAVPNWVVPAMWVILGAAVLIFGYFVLRHFTWKGALKRKAKAVLEEDEPERTLDEWLAMADQHLSEGRYREAVRAMYLSCLLKFDEAGIARFIRGETNWEHLHRISASPKKPASIDFRPPTQAFDRIWYGYHVRGAEDVEQFRAWYQQITEALRSAPK